MKKQRKQVCMLFVITAFFMPLALHIDAKPIPLPIGKHATYIFESTVSESSDPGGNISVGDSCTLTLFVDVDNPASSPNPTSYRINSGSIVFEQGYKITISSGYMKVYNNSYYPPDDDYGDNIYISPVWGYKPDLSGRQMDSSYPYVALVRPGDWLSSEDAPKSIDSNMYPNWDFRWGGYSTRVRVFHQTGFDKVTVIWPESDDVSDAPEEETTPNIGQSMNYVQGLNRRVHLYAKKILAGVADE